MIVLLVSTLLFSGIATVVENDHAVATCDVPLMKEGHSTTLTCHFSDDFADLQSKVSIVHYSTDVQKVVLLCNMSTGQPECESEPGYYVAGNVNGTLFVVIPHTSRTHIGRYSCQLYNSAPASHVTCSFSFRQVETTCDIPAVRVQQPTNLTCQFNEDMLIGQKKIKVIHSYKGKEESVLLCYWNSGKPNCQENYGFLFSGVISNRLVLTIKHATQEHVGDYRCKVFGSAIDSDETCSFVLQGIQANCSIPQVEYGRTTNLTCIFSENVALSRTDFQIIHIPFNNSDEARNVLKCLWDGESPDCIENNSYNFTYTITEIVRLRIDYATSYHAGIYSCKALINSEENADNCTFIPFGLAYLINLTINGYSGKKLLKQNESASIVCEWKNGNPPTTARLMKNDHEILAESNSGNITYDIPEVHCRDAGTIKCVIGDTDQLTVLLLVECPPVFMRTSAEMQNITIGHTFRIQVPVRTHTTEIIRCEITRLLNPSRTNYSEAKIVKDFNTQAVQCSTPTGSHKEECFCSLTGSPPDLTFILYLQNVREEYNGVWQARINNGIGTGQVTLSIQLFELFNYGNSTSPQINDLKDMDSTIVGSVALICAMLAVIVSCVKLRKGHLLRRTVNEYEEIDTQSVMSVCRTTPASVVLVRSTPEKTLSAPFPIINLGSSLPNVSSDETYSCLQLK